MKKQKYIQKKVIYIKLHLSLPDVKCNNEMAYILLLLTFAFNKKSINEITEVLFYIARHFELTNNMVKSKVILLKKNLLTVKNTRRTIY